MEIMIVGDRQSHHVASPTSPQLVTGLSLGSDTAGTVPIALCDIQWGQPSGGMYKVGSFVWWADWGSLWLMGDRQGERDSPC